MGGYSGDIIFLYGFDISCVCLRSGAGASPFQSDSGSWTGATAARRRHRSVPSVDVLDSPLTFKHGSHGHCNVDCVCVCVFSYRSYYQCINKQCLNKSSIEHTAGTNLYMCDIALCVCMWVMIHKHTLFITLIDGSVHVCLGLFFKFLLPKCLLLNVCVLIYRRQKRNKVQF